ncbi:hypothetical protein [Nitrososphaera sp.]|uniref:hypothetical protein n=1 Tax=Nitrososphaera sp. TaxID=1971748 RepID=UPI00307F2BE1
MAGTGRRERKRKARTQAVSGAGSIAAKIGRFQSNIKKSWCACVDSSIPAFSMSEKIRPGYVAAKRRGVRIRYVTEITRENLPRCKELMEFAELRHLGNVSGSFAVSEKEFVAGIRGKNGRQIAKLVYSSMPELVAAQQEMFETLWANAAPAQARIRELES